VHCGHVRKRHCTCIVQQLLVICAIHVKQGRSATFA
jgi:hypothetical protein